MKKQYELDSSLLRPGRVHNFRYLTGDYLSCWRRQESLNYELLVGVLLLRNLTHHNSFGRFSGSSCSRQLFCFGGELYSKFQGHQRDIYTCSRIPTEEIHPMRTLQPCRLQDSDTPTWLQGLNMFPELSIYGICRWGSLKTCLEANGVEILARTQKTMIYYTSYRYMLALK